MRKYVAEELGDGMVAASPVEDGQVVVGMTLITTLERLKGEVWLVDDIHTLKNPRRVDTTQVFHYNNEGKGEK